MVLSILMGVLLFVIFGAIFWFVYPYFSFFILSITGIDILNSLAFSIIFIVFPTVLSSYFLHTALRDKFFDSDLDETSDKKEKNDKLDKNKTKASKKDKSSKDKPFVNEVIEGIPLIVRLPEETVEDIFVSSQKLNSPKNNSTNNSNGLETSNSEQITIMPENSQPRKDFDFFLTGCEEKNEHNLDIQTLLIQYVEKNFQWDNELNETESSKNQFFSASNDGLELNNLFFQLEGNIIKVIEKNLGHIGYVPEDESEDLKTSLNHFKSFRIFGKILGGKIDNSPGPYKINLQVMFKE